MKFPTNTTKKERKYLKEVYESTLLKNRKRSKQKARAIAKAKFYEECFKIFLKKENEIVVNEIWNRKNKKKLFSYIKENIDYKKYKIGNNIFIVSTDKKILEKYSDSERKGMLRSMNDEYEQEILFKTKKKYNIRLDPDMYYVIR